MKRVTVKQRLREVVIWGTIKRSYLLQYKLEKSMSLIKVSLLIILEKLFTLFAVQHSIGK